MAENVIDATVDSFGAEVLSSELPVLVDFWAPWCGPCKVLAPHIDRIAKEMSSTLKVVKVDVQAHPQLAKDYGVTSIPVLMVFQAGKMVAEKRGGTGGYPALKALLDPVVSPPHTA